MLIPISNNSVKIAKDSLLSGKPIIYPTDTLYSFGAIATDTNVIQSINQLKKRVSPLSIIVPDIKSIESFGYVKTRYIDYIQKILPGKYTILIEAKKHDLSPLIQNKSKLIGIRIPDNKFTNLLVKSLNQPIVTTSVNIHGEPPLIDLDKIERNYPNIDIFHSKRKLDSEGSTILDLSKESISIVRLGDEKNIDELFS